MFGPLKNIMVHVHVKVNVLTKNQDTREVLHLTTKSNESSVFSP